MCMCFVSLLLAGILPALESVLRDADYAVTPQHAADVLHSLGKATQGQDCAEHEQTIHKVASKLVAQLLGKPALNSMAQTAPGPPPIQQLNNKQLSLAVWSLSKQVAAKHIAMDDSALQFVDAVAAHAVASTVMDQHPNRACEHWSRMLYGIAKMGIKCEERPAIQHLFDLAVHRMSAMLQKGQRCEAQSMSNALWAFAVAGYRGSLEQMVPILDSRLKDLMKSALPQVCGCGCGCLYGVVCVCVFLCVRARAHVHVCVDVGLDLVMLGSVDDNVYVCLGGRGVGGGRAP
eukprot:scaffold206540_cov21-Tisochrysis_lutea.AAC.1